MVEKKVENKGLISQTQAEIMRGISNFMTISQIAKWRKCSRQAIYKVINRLLEAGLINKIGSDMGLTEKGKEGLHSFIGLTYKKRYHNLAIKIEIKESPRNWELKRSKLITLPYFNKRVKLKNNDYDLFSYGKVQVKTTTKSVIVRIPTIYDDTMEGATLQAMDIFFDSVPKIESSFRIKLIKDRRSNMTIISQEAARLKDSMAKLYAADGKKLYFKNERGEVWLISDYSFNTDELETIHPTSADEDMATVDKFMLDLKNNPMKLTDLRDMIGNVTANQMVFDKNMASHLEVLNKLGNAVDNLTGKVEELGEKREIKINKDFKTKPSQTFKRKFIDHLKKPDERTIPITDAKQTTIVKTPKDIRAYFEELEKEKR